MTIMRFFLIPINIIKSIFLDNFLEIVIFKRIDLTGEIFFFDRDGQLDKNEDKQIDNHNKSTGNSCGSRRGIGLSCSLNEIINE